MRVPLGFKLAAQNLGWALVNLKRVHDHKFDIVVLCDVLMVEDHVALLMVFKSRSDLVKDGLPRGKWLTATSDIDSVNVIPELGAVEFKEASEYLCFCASVHQLDLIQVIDVFDC